MINPQLENGFIKIASGKLSNDILTALIRANLNGTEYQLILLIIRKTWGYKKKEDLISLTQFQNYTNKSRKSICRCLKILVSKSILVKKKISVFRTSYQLNKHFDQWVLTSVKKYTSVKNDTSLVSKMTLPIYTKDNNTKEKRTFLQLTKYQKESLIREFKDLNLEDLEYHRKNFNDWWIGTGQTLYNPYRRFKMWIRINIKKQKEKEPIKEKKTYVTFENGKKIYHPIN